jgi:2-polyprenyl-6-hydroxyphenyl methylase/3-demethylubiquinone-9 3-methyltransferase
VRPAHGSSPAAEMSFATLNRNPKSFLFAIIGAGIHPAPGQTRDPFLPPLHCARGARAMGLKQRPCLQDLTGLHYNPFRRTYSLGGNTHVNYLMHFRKFHNQPV